MNLTGKTIDRYRILERLGQGGMGTVYLAEDLRVKRRVAIKLLPAEYLNDEKFRARFDRESETSARLEHPAIVPTYDFGEAEGQPYIVMRHMAGGSLRNRLEKGRIPDAEVVEILSQVSEALEYAHRRGVVHRDLKPDNILFDEHGKAHVADFGIAKLQEATTELTGAGIIGTPAYMSPEQVQGDKDLDGRSDLYSLGIIAFEMFTGQKPFTAETPARLLMKHVLDPVPRILIYRGDLPDGVERVIGKALAKEPEARFAGPMQFVRSLRDSLVGTTTEIIEPIVEDATLVEPDEAAAPARPAPRSRAWLFTCGALGLLLVAGVVVGAVMLGSRLLFGNPTETPSVALTRPAPSDTARPALQASATAEDSPVATRTSTPTGQLAASSTPSATTPPSTGIGDLIAFHSDRFGGFDIFTVNWRTGEVNRVTDLSGNEKVPRWSPNGQQLVFESTADGNSELYVIKLDNSRLTRLTNNNCNDWAPHWSPDSQRIVFYSDCDGNREIYVMGSDGSNRRQLTFTTGENTYNWFPIWSPDGTRIIYASNIAGRYHVHVMDADGGNPLRLAPGCSPEFSPDGNQIVFTQYCTDSGDILLMDADGGNVRVLLEGDFRNPSWSPDGSMIAYQQGDAGRFEIWVMDADGSNRVQLTTLNAESAVPAWQP